MKSKFRQNSGGTSLSLGWRGRLSCFGRNGRKPSVLNEILHNHPHIGIEVTLDNPAQVAWLVQYHAPKRFAFLLAEVDAEFPILPAQHALAIGVQRIVRHEVFVHLVHRLRQVVVLLKLRLQHVQRGTCIRLGTMCARVRAVAVELDGRGEVARLLAVIDALHIDVLACGGGEVQPAPSELLLKNRNVKAVRVEAREVAVLEVVENPFRHIRKRRAVLHEFVRDAVDGRRFGWNRDGRVQKPAHRDFGSVGHDLDGRKLDDAIAAWGCPGRLDVEDDEWARKFQIEHIRLFL